MSARTAGSIAFVGGLLILAVGLIVQFVVAPAQAQFPDDVDRTRNYEGELHVLLDPEALATENFADVLVRDVPVTIDRSIQTLEVDGRRALVYDGSVVSGPTGPILASEDVYAIDRKTMEHVENFTDDARVIDRDGLVVGFPIGTDADEYAGFNGDTLTTNTITFLREEEHQGLNTYVFSAASGPDPITDPVVLATLPSELPKAAVENLVPALDLSDEARAGLAEVLPTLPDPIPLAYTYTYETTYWVEPDSGVLVDYNKVESRGVAIDLGEQAIPVGEVMNLEYAQTAASVDDAVDDANDARSRLFWQGRVLPYGLIGIGALVALLGLLILQRRRTDTVPADRPLDPTPPADVSSVS